MIIMILVLSLAAVALLLSLPMADSDTVDDESITFSYRSSYVSRCDSSNVCLKRLLIGSVNVENLGKAEKIGMSVYHKSSCN